MKLNNFYNRIHDVQLFCREIVPSRFHLAQLLFVLSITFGWYLNDGYRRGLMIVAVLLMSRKDYNLEIVSCWNGLNKLGGYLLILLAVWVTFIPLFCGIEPFYERVLGIARPIEIVACCIYTMFFARDVFFEKYFYRASIISSCVLFLIVFIKRLCLSFSVEKSDWIFNKHASFVGIVLVSLLPWLIYTVSNESERKNIRTICTIIFPFAVVTIFVTYYRTIWVASVVQLLAAMILAYYMINVNLCRFIKYSLLLFASIIITIILAYNANDAVKCEIKDNIDSFLSLDQDFESFSSKRGEIWIEASNLIGMRKLCGYGWIDYNELATIKKNHPHSSYLQAGVCVGMPGMILYILVLVVFVIIALRHIVCDQTTSPIIYTVILLIVSTMVGGLTESYFFTSRQYLIPFWSTLAILLSPLYTKKIN